MIELPEKLIYIRDQVVDHVLKNTPLPDKLSELIDWYETDGWDVLVPTWAEEEHVQASRAFHNLGKGDWPRPPPPPP